MAWSYVKLWVLLVKNKKNKSYLRSCGISPAVITKMGKDEPVSMETLGRICDLLDCKLEDIVEWIPEKSNNIQL